MFKRILDEIIYRWQLLTAESVTVTQLPGESLQEMHNRVMTEHFNITRPITVK